MKADSLVKLIKIAVKEAIREELGQHSQALPRVEESRPASRPARMQPVEAPMSNGSSSISELLNMTRSAMTNEEYRRVMNVDSSAAQGFNPAAFRSPTAAAAPGGPEPGIDIDSLDFVSNAKRVLTAANQKDKMRNGL